VCLIIQEIIPATKTPAYEKAGKKACAGAEAPFQGTFYIFLFGSTP